MAELYPKRIVAAGLVACLGLMACSDNSESKSRHSVPTVPKIQVKYFSDGSRELITSGLNVSDEINTGEGLDNNTGYSGLTDIFQFCDGPDLVEQTKGWTSNEVISTSISRSVDYRGCADGRLTPSDFTPRSSAESQ